MTSAAPPTPSAPASFSRKLNRRRYTRVSTRQMRSCFLAQGSGPSDGWVVDISLGGVFLRTSWPLPVGEKLAIELPRSGKAAPVCVRGRVVSSTPVAPTASRSGMGVRFDALDPMTLSELRDLIRDLAPAGTKLEQPAEDNEVTTVAGIPLPELREPLPSAPVPRMSAPMPRLTATTPTPIQTAQPSAPRMGVRHLGNALELEKLKNHAKGLLMQVGDLQTQLNAKDREIETLREAIVRLQASNAQLLRNR